MGVDLMFNKSISRKMLIEGKMMNVFNLDEYNEDMNEIYGNKIAIRDGDYVYPYSKKFNNQKPCISPTGIPGFYRENPVKESEKEMYDAKNIVDLGDVNSMKEMISKQEHLRDKERDFVNDMNNILTPVIDDQDDAVLKGLKLALLAKQSDFKSYEDSLGPNPNNLKRIVTNPENHTVSLSKLKEYCNGFGMKATMIIEDKNENVRDPMNMRLEFDICDNDSEKFAQYKEEIDNKINNSLMSDDDDDAIEPEGDDD